MKRFTATIIFLFAFASFAYPDEVFLKSGKVVQGKIIEQTNSFLRLDVGSGIQLRYYFDEIKKIQRDDAAPGPKLFELKSAPLLPVKQKQETNKVPEQTPVNNLTTKAQDLRDVERVVNNYLSLIAKPLPADPKLRKQLFEQLAALEDLDSMASYLLFRQTIERAQRNSSGKQAGAASIREKFLEAQIGAFLARYPVDAGAASRSFQISDIELSNNQDQAIATVKYKVDSIRFKLHKINSKWSIYSTE